MQSNLFLINNSNIAIKCLYFYSCVNVTLLVPLDNRVIFIPANVYAGKVIQAGDAKNALKVTMDIQNVSDVIVINWDRL